MHGNPDPSPSTRFPPGQSGNPGGKPVGARSVSSRLRELLESNTINGKPIRDGKQVADLVTEVIMAHALKGDFRFMDLLLNRTEGKVADMPTAAKSEDADPIRAILERLRKAQGGP